MRKGNVQKSPSFVGACFHETHFVGGKVHDVDDTDKFGQSFHGKIVDFYFFRAFVFNYDFDDVRAIFFCDFRLDIRALGVERNKLLFAARTGGFAKTQQINRFQHIRLSACVFAGKHVDALSESNGRRVVVSEIFQLKRFDKHTVIISYRKRK